MRAMNLANELVTSGHEVVLWSSAFYHQEKRQRSIGFESLNISRNLIIKLIPSSGYVKNIGLKRFIDHIQLGFNLHRALRDEINLPDVAFIGYPPIEFAYVASKFMFSRNIPYMLDVKDMWPDYFTEKLPGKLQFLGRILFLHWYWMKNFVFKKASAFSAISKGYMNWMLQDSGRQANHHDCITPLTTSYADLYNQDEINIKAEWSTRNVHIKDEAIFYYAGNISTNIDLAAISAAAEYYDRTNKDVRFVICGQGIALDAMKLRLEKYRNVIFAGWVNREMLKFLSEHSLASILPYNDISSFSEGIPNKFYDAMALGTPVISCLSGEVKELISTNKVGFYYENGNGVSFISVCNNYLNSPDLRLIHSKNANSLYEERFNVEIVYNNLSITLNELGRKGVLISS